MTLRTALTTACILPLLAACGGEEETYDETPPQEGEFGVGEEEDVNDRASTEASGIEEVDAAPGDGPPGGEATFEAPGAPSAFNEEIVPLTARGNEPGWLLEITGSTLSLEYDYGEQSLTADTYESAEMDGGARFAVPDQDLRVMVREARCTAASGMPYPYTVEVRLGERSFQGCGGETRDVLVGEAWTVTAINGEAAAQSETPPSLRFTEADIGGSTGCNTYRAAYTLTGETIDISAGESTQMACADDLMAQEEDFLQALETVDRLRIEGEGSLTLEGESAMIEARRGQALNADAAAPEGGDGSDEG